MKQPSIDTSPITPEKYHEICGYMRDVIRNTRWWGRVYAVGGCNRDLLMGNLIKDVDFAVEVPDGGVKLGYTLASRKLTTGRVKMFKRYCTAMLRLKEFPEHEIEIVQTRSGSYPLKSPEKAKKFFGRLHQDAQLRDLTINSLYYDICRERMLDPTGMGVNDIELHRLRTPAPPDITLADDPLRVLRIIRFSLRYRWEIDSALWEAMKRHISELSLLKPERVSAEMEKLNAMPQAPEAARMLQRLGMDAQ